MTPPIGGVRAGLYGAEVSAIPDEQDLLSRYDFSVEDGSSVTDQTGNGNDLTEGAYTGVSATINGVQAGEFDGVDDYVAGQFGSNSQPNHIFIVFEVVTTANSENENIFDAYSRDTQTLFIDGAVTNNEYNLFAGSRLGGSVVADAGDIVVSSALFDGASSELRINGTSYTGGVGSSPLDGLTLGKNGGDGTSFANIKIGEVLVYPQDKSAIVADVEQYLTDKWGPTALA